MQDCPPCFLNIFYPHQTSDSLFPTSPGSLAASRMSQLWLQHSYLVHQVAAMLNIFSSTPQTRNLAVFFENCTCFVFFFHYHLAPLCPLIHPLPWNAVGVLVEVCYFNISSRYHLFQIFHFLETKLFSHPVFVHKVLLKHNYAHYILAIASSLLQWNS